MGDVGVRFHPTEYEIITYFLERKMRGLGFPVYRVANVDVCKCEPWDLPKHSPRPSDDQLWYYFNAPAYKIGRTKRTDRTTPAGFWKVTGKDRPIRDKQGNKEIGFKKNLVYYKGRVPNGIRTDWVMHEYHSNNANCYQKEYVFCRLKLKSGDLWDTANEGNRDLASDPGNYVTATSPVNRDLSYEDMLSLFEDNGLGSSSFSAVLGMSKPNQGTPYSNGFGNEITLPNTTQLDTTEQDNAFVDSLWADQDEFSGERSVGTHFNDFTPSRSLRGGYARDSSDTDTQCGVWFDENISSTEYPQKPMVAAFYETSSSDGELFMAESFFVDEFPDSDTDMPEVNCLELVVDEFPTNTRASKSQHTPKSQSFIEKKCTPEEIHLPSKVSHAAVSKAKVREAAVRAVDPPKTENSIVKLDKEQKMPQTSNAKTSLKSRDNKGDSSNRKGSFIFLETTPLEHKNYPPSVYLGNVLVSLLLIIFFVREMVYLR